MCHLPQIISPILRAAGAAVAAVLLLPAVPLAGQDLRYTRPIDVPEAGWVRVPIAPEILRRAAPAGGHLRLFGPDGGELPFRRVAPAEEAAPDRAPDRDPDRPERTLTVTVSRPECRIGEEPAVGPRTVCSLPLGFAGRLLSRLHLTVAAGEPVGYRLLVPEAGRWEPVAEGVWSAPLPETPHEVELDLSLPDPTEPLRLELYGGERPELVRASAEMGSEALLFEALRAGRHTLAYGPVVYRSSRSEDVRPPSGVEPARIPPGPEETGEAAAGGTPLSETAGPAPSVRFDRRWRVTSEAPEPGSLHRLTLEPPVYAVARRDLGDLRLLAGDLQVPYVRSRPAAPRVAAALRGVRPRVDPGGGVARVEIELEEREIPLTALVIHSAAERVRARVRALAVGSASPGVEPDVAPLTSWLDWSCDRRPPLSCRRVVDLAGDRVAEALAEPDRRLVLELDAAELRGRAGSEPSGTEARDTAPEPLDLDLLRRRDVLLFPWPSGDRPPWLVAGATDLGAPEYELGDRYEELLARPWVRAGLTSDDAAAGDGGVGRWTVAITLGIALLTLLILLDRELGRREPSRP